MRSQLDRLARNYPTLDMQCLSLLQYIAENPGMTMAEIAEELGVTHQNVHFHVHTMADGRRGREKNAHGLLIVERDVFDKRRRNITLTDAGEAVIKAIRPLTK